MFVQLTSTVVFTLAFLLALAIGGWMLVTGILDMIRGLSATPWIRELAAMGLMKVVFCEFITAHILQIGLRLTAWLTKGELNGTQTSNNP
jgi:hypothetical protein